MTINNEINEEAASAALELSATFKIVGENIKNGAVDLPIKDFGSHAFRILKDGCEEFFLCCGNPGRDENDDESLSKIEMILAELIPATSLPSNYESYSALTDALVLRLAGSFAVVPKDRYDSMVQRAKYL